MDNAYLETRIDPNAYMKTIKDARILKSVLSDLNRGPQLNPYEFWEKSSPYIDKLQADASWQIRLRDRMINNLTQPWHVKLIRRVTRWLKRNR
jgi:hypothetical protein